MTEAKNSALRLLARREHGAKELSDKLKRKGFLAQEVQDALDSCQQLNYQSDARFVEMVVRSRINQGYGPLRIKQELKQKGIDETLIEHELQQEHDNWLEYALAVWQKKYKEHAPLSVQERQKQQRFLLYRGFDMTIISQVMKHNNK